MKLYCLLVLGVSFGLAWSPVTADDCGCPKQRIGNQQKIIQAKGTQVVASYDVDPQTGNYYFGIRSETPPPKGESDLRLAAQGRLFSPDLKPLTPLKIFAAARDTGRSDSGNVLCKSQLPRSKIPGNLESGNCFSRGSFGGTACTTSFSSRHSCRWSPNHTHFTQAASNTTDKNGLQQVGERICAALQQG